MIIFNRKQWPKKIKLYGDWPEWLCSECLKGYFYPEKDHLNKYKFLIGKSSERKYLNDHGPNADENCYTYITIKLVCTNPICLSESLLSGKRSIVEEYVDNDIDRFFHCPVVYLEPFFFTIPPQVITIPGDKLDDYVKFLYQSFKIFFDDPSSAANKIRIFLEYLAPVTTNDSEKLHSRLERKLKQTYPEACELLIACKWIGNDASHQSNITHDDILDAYEFIERALLIIYPIELVNPLSNARDINLNKKSLSKII